MVRLSGRPRRAGRCTGETQTWVRGATLPGRRLRWMLTTCRRCGCSVPGAVAAGARGRRLRRCRGGLLHEALRRCLTQRGERQRRVHGVAHQCSEGALLRAAGCGQRGEHVFGKLRPRSDGNRKIRGRKRRRKPPIWLCAAPPEHTFCKRSCRALSAGRRSARRLRRHGPPAHRGPGAPRRRRPWSCCAAADSVVNVIRSREPARRPDGVVIMCDVAREDASVVIDELKQLGDPSRRARSRSS